MEGKCNVSSILESKMNEHYRKIFAVVGLIFSTIFFFTQGVFGEIVQYSILKSDKKNYEMSLFGGTLEMLAYILGFFILYAILGVVIFIVFGEIFIRVSEYFHINSRLYRYMVKAKDVMVMNPVEYYEKHKNEIDKNFKK